MTNDSLHPSGLDSSVIQWVAKSIQSSDFNVIQLAGDASARRYYRIIENDTTWVLMHWEPFHETEYPFISVQRHFKECGVQVPEIKAIGAKEGLLLLEDLGDLTVERKYWENSNPETSRHFYEATIDEILKIHDKATYFKTNSTALTTKFDTAKFMWEMNYAKEHLLQGLLKVQFDEKLTKELDQAFLSFCSLLDNEPKVICHRDYHSRNVMIKRDKVFVIDFQDARLGPVQYDLVSLFKDSYVDIPDSYADQLMNYYLDQSLTKKNKNFSRENFNTVYEIQSLQRCFKACGSFASFMSMRKDKRYLKYLAPTLRRVMKSLLNFPEYKILQSILIDSGALEKNYESMP